MLNDKEISSLNKLDGERKASRDELNRQKRRLANKLQSMKISKEDIKPKVVKKTPKVVYTLKKKFSFWRYKLYLFFRKIFKLDTTNDNND